ncbi:MAG: hypothetical protein QOK39_1849, partial [Acidimicrobiaceae bacterium]|nr:hypothetical protein [Acidimicrobiaceae bacterium]
RIASTTSKSFQSRGWCYATIGFGAVGLGLQTMQKLAHHLGVA